jgi:hypothetical protein
MISKWVQKELNKCSVKMEQKSEYEFYIPKQDPMIPQVNHYYIIKLSDYLVHPYEGFDFHDRYNHGVVPNHVYMEVELVSVSGKLFQVRGVGYDLDNSLEYRNDYWEGFLPGKSIEFIREVE